MDLKDEFEWDRIGYKGKLYVYYVLECKWCMRNYIM